MAVTNEKSVSEAIKYSIHLATLAATSSNMQLWEFYPIVSPDIIKEIKVASFDQNGAKTAQQLIVVAARKDLWRKRMQANITFLKSQFGNKSETEYSKREKFALNYYKKIIPTFYTDFFGILGAIKIRCFYIIGLLKPIYRQAKQSDMRIVAHKSAGLAAQNFIIAWQQ